MGSRRAGRFRPRPARTRRAGDRTLARRSIPRIRLRTGVRSKLRTRQWQGAPWRLAFPAYPLAGTAISGCRAHPAPQNGGILTLKAPSGSVRAWKSRLPASNSGRTLRSAEKRFPINYFAPRREALNDSGCAPPEADAGPTRPAPDRLRDRTSWRSCTWNLQAIPGRHLPLPRLPPSNDS